MVRIHERVCLQEKTLESMDAEESPAHSNGSDSEAGPLDRDLALAEKEKV